MASLDNVKNFWHFWYYQYILHTGLYMLESWERGIFNSLAIGFTLMASYTTYLFLPGHLHMLARFVATCVLGLDHDHQMAAGVGNTIHAVGT